MMELKEQENPEKLRECLKNGTLSLRDLDNKKRGSSRGRRRRSKGKKGGNVTTDDATKAQTVEKPRSTPKASKISRPSKIESSSKNAEKSLKWETQTSESEMVVRSILDEVFDHVSRYCSATKYSAVKEQTNTMTPGLPGASDERIVATRNIYAEQRRTIQELLYKAARENVRDLITRATTRRHDIPSPDKGQLDTTAPLLSANYDRRQRAYQQWMNTEKLKMQKMMYMAASEIVQYFLTFPATRARFAEERILMKRESYENQRKITQKLLYKAAQENVNDLIIQATPNCDIPGPVKEELATSTLVQSEECDTILRTLSEKRKAEKLAMQKIMYNTASEVVDDLFTSAAKNASLKTLSETDVLVTDELEEDPVAIQKSWRRFFCCVKAKKQQRKEKKEKRGLLARLCHLFNRR
ncbi:uncharacterized protein LOC133183969 isoform X2 [Saccostrea echinata]|uniref:uncharacterized protein LOC133183969 isoform X2 n=1 Tax=Saccostrea echinata TaxID=191078 RepID=UPI002A8213DB|nr:uncharacterized protein LOC133183969 isoform X2 [Saccostrea echinata]